MFCSVSSLCVIFHLFNSLVFAEWTCPSDSRFCFQRIHEFPLTWNETRNRCVRMGADLPGADHLKELSRAWMQDSPFWTSLCFSNGRLQWLGINSYEERDLTLIDKLLPDLTSPYVLADQMYCFHTDRSIANTLKTFGLTLKDSQHLITGMCVTDRRSALHHTIPHQKGKILSVSTLTQGADLDWGPIGQNRDGFVNILGLKSQSLKLKCDVKTNDVQSAFSIRWTRDGGYMGNFSQEISFLSEENLIPWIGYINCEATNGDQVPVQGQGFHLVMWNTVTARLVSTCVSCRLQSIIEAAKIILTQFVEMEISSGYGRALEFYSEPPVIQRSSVSFVVHIRNRRIDKFDFLMAQKLGSQFQLSIWAKSRALFLSNDSDMFLDIISPCNMALPQDRNNMTWIGYLGQTVPSGNFIDGAICVDNSGDIITRSCGLPDLRPIRYQECSAMKPRREEPECFNGFEPADGRCYRKTEMTNFAAALASCWAGWSIQTEILMPDSLSNWVQISREWMNRYSSGDTQQSSSLVWLPLRRVNKATPLQTPVWNWKTVNNQWIAQPNVSYAIDETSDEDALCAAYDLENNRMVMQPCQNQLSMICNRPVLPQPISALISSQPDHVGQYFCPPGWLTHWLVLDAGICYKRFTLKDAVDADEALEVCVRNGGHLAVAPTHNMRIALEQVDGAFNNRSNIVDSWIGLKNRNEEPGAFSWVRETPYATTSSTYNWQPYSEFGSGYGVSTGINQMWWNWPRDAKLRGLICQKTVSDWQNGIRLRLETSSDPVRDGEYALVFTYDPKISLQDENNLRSINLETRRFWRSDFDVICYFANYVRRFSFPRGFRRQYRALVPVPATIGSGPLTCEAWLNRPAFRFQSNTIIHRPSRWYNFVVLVAKRNRFYQSSNYHQSRNNWNEESDVDDFLQRLNTNRRYFRDIMNNLSVTSTIEPGNNSAADVEIIYYKMSFLLPPEAKRFDLLTKIRQCQADQYSLEFHSDMEAENILHLLLQSCLPLVYNRGEEEYQLIEVRSTVACPSIIPFGIGMIGRDVPDNIPTVYRLSWPRTEIGEMTRSTQPCWIVQHLIHRTCTGSFERGAIWGPPKIMALNKTVETDIFCQTPDSTSSKLDQLERTSRSVAMGSISTDTILRELLIDWEQPQLSIANLESTVATLHNLLGASRNQTTQLNRLLVTNILEKMVQPGKTPLEELQFLPNVLNNFIQLFSDLPILDNRRSRVRINIGNQVSIVAEGNDSAFFGGSQQLAPAMTIDFNRVIVTVAKDPENAGILSTIVTVLPTELLAIDPLTKNNIIDLHKADPSDPTRASFILGKFTAGQTTVHVDQKAATLTASTPFTLAFKEDDNGEWLSSPENTFLCARWNSWLSKSRGGWLTGDCYYLGVDENTGTHVCQCHSSGTYGLFRSEGESALRLALIRRLPIIINVVLFLLMTFSLVVRSIFIYRKAVREMDLVEMGARLQIVIAWTGMLFFHLSQYFVPGHVVGCVILTTLFQFFLTAAFFWQCTLMVIRRWQIQERWIKNQNACIIKLSFAVWALASIIVVTIPIYKWKYVNATLISDCWLEDPVDFGLTLAIVCITSFVSLVLNLKNICDQKKMLATSEWNANDFLAAVSTPLMTLAGLLAIVVGSWLHSASLTIAFSCVSSLLGLLWMCTFWTLVASPLVKHTFQRSNISIGQDLQLKTVYGSSIEYLSDR